MVKDFQFALRGLLKRPAFAVIAVLTLALGIGANTAIFSVVNAVLLRPLPLKDPDRLMTFWHSAPAKGLAHMDVNDTLFSYYRDRTRAFESLAAFEDGEFSLTGNGEPEVVTGAVVTYNYFSVLGREPLYGRTFSAQEDTPGKNTVTILSYAPAVGVALGLLASIGFTRLLKGLLFGISASDPGTFAVIAVLLVGVALLACWIPALRATRVDPLEALKSE